MAFIKCTRCGKQINNVAGGIIKCPYCQNMMKISEPKAEQQEDKKNDNETARKCPKCGGINLTYQREQIGGIGASTNKVVIQKPKKVRDAYIGLQLDFGWNLCIGFLLDGGGDYYLVELIVVD